LVVVSKLKKYIKDRSGMNTSDGAMAVLSAHLRALSNEAIRTAARDGRKTVLDRDFPPPTER
jgi:histone H3/H4